MPSSTPDPREGIRARALELGFDAARFARADDAGEAGRHLETFLAESRHGSMDWMANNAGRRAAPKSLWPDAKSVIVLGANYGPATDPKDQLARKSNGAISVYAQ